MVQVVEAVPLGGLITAPIHAVSGDHHAARNAVRDAGLGSVASRGTRELVGLALPRDPIFGYHEAPSKYRKSILRSGLTMSRDGRMGRGVYFVQAFGQAKRIGIARHGAGDFDIWKADLNHLARIGELQRGRHSAWAGLDEFTELCVDHSYLFHNGSIEVELVCRSCH